MSDIDEVRVVALYTEDKWTLRMIAREYETDHHAIARVLARYKIPVTQKGRIRPPFTDAHRAAISKTSRGRKPWSVGLEMTSEFKRKIMATKLGTSRDLSVDRYPHFEKLRLLTRLTSKHRSTLATSDDVRFAFIDRFFFDRGFNAVYDAWELSGRCKWWFPSLDHIDPKANGGSWSLDNLRFITWFENRAKANMSLSEWETLKKTANMRSDLFIESICPSVMVRSAA